MYQFNVPILIGTFAVGIVSAATTLRDSEGVNTLTVNVDKGTETIAPDIYGHFAEHLAP